MSYPKLNFVSFLSPEAAEFPYCCASGFLMSYNTHLRDPVRGYREILSHSSPEEAVRKALAREKKRKNKR